jgi:predicted signal transduction protein with EAL and GGDEF domain
VDQLQFETRPGKMLQLAISVGASVFPHDGNTYETLLATADGRMYRDKTRRKREPGGDGAHAEQRSQTASTFTDLELQKAAVGIL